MHLPVTPVRKYRALLQGNSKVMLSRICGDGVLARPGMQCCLQEIDKKLEQTRQDCSRGNKVEVRSKFRKLKQYKQEPGKVNRNHHVTCCSLQDKMGAGVLGNPTVPCWHRQCHCPIKQGHGIKQEVLLEQHRH